MNDQEREAKKAEAQDKAKAISERIGKKVHCIFVDKDDEVVIGFLQEPTLRTKMAAVNYLGSKQLDLAGETILSTSLIKEESDPRLQLPTTDDNVYVSAVLVCNTLIDVYSSEVKKN